MWGKETPVIFNNAAATANTTWKGGGGNQLYVD